MDNQNKDELTVAGYIFATHEDAELAKNEINKISYIESKMDMTNMTVVAGIYNKALENRTFQTPVGMEFMHSLYNMLNDAGLKDQVEPFPLYTTFKRMDLSDSKKKRVFSTKVEEEASIKMKLRNSILINVILVVLIIALILISYNGSTMNAINYKAAVTNEYAAWEQELKNREAAVREKERELNMDYSE